jgi:hypothetical protein
LPKNLEVAQMWKDIVFDHLKIPLQKGSEICSQHFSIGVSEKIKRLPTFAVPSVFSNCTIDSSSKVIKKSNRRTIINYQRREKRLKHKVLLLCKENMNLLSEIKLMKSRLEAYKGKEEQSQLYIV